MKFNKDSRWYFSTQLIVVFLVTCLVAAFSVDTWVRHVETNYLMDNYQTKNSQTVAILSRSAAVPVLKNDLTELDELIKAISAVDDTLIFAQITAPNKVVLSQIGQQEDIKKTQEKYIRQHSVPIIHDKQEIARINIAWNTRVLHNNISHHVNQIRWVVLLTVALLSLILFSSLKRLVVDPIEKINNKLQSISNGQSSPKIKQNPLISKEFSFLSHIANRLDYQYQKQLETQKSLAIAKDKAEAANNTKNEFLGVVSHELRTPINGVMGLLELLMKDKKLTEEQLNHISVAHSSADSLLAIVSNILDFSSIESGKLQIKNLELNLRQLINEVVSMVSSTADKKGLDLSSEFDHSIPENLRGDPVRIRQVLTNLLLNATKFTEAGSISVEAALLERSDDTVQVKLSVTDTGIGISEKQKEELFSSFHQGDSSSTRKHGGTGLGLAINRKLVNAMGGEITVESEVNKGSTFCFTLPFKITQTNTQLKPADQIATTDELAPLNGSLLLVEDNPVNKMVATKMLRSFGLQVTHAVNGKVGFETFQNAVFDAVLMDIQMPEMNGYDSTLNIRKWETVLAKEQTPIIALTANVLTEDRARCFEVGMDDFLAKPIKINDLHKTLKYWLEPHEAARTS